MQSLLQNLWKKSLVLPANNIPVWDGWRGLAIMCVLVGHYMGTDFIKEDRLGVDIFFVLSGMLMSRLLFEKRVDLKTFYIRRFSRIYPALLVFVVYSFLIGLLAGWEFSLTEIVANLSFLRTYIPADPHIWSGDVPIKNLWSLNVEEHAYVLMSLMTLFIIKQSNAFKVLLSVGVMSILISLYYHATQNYNETFYLLRTESAICFIMFSASYRLYVAKNNPPVWQWMPAITLLLAGLCYLVDVPFWMSFTLPPLLLAFSINHLQQAASSFQRVLSFKWLRLLGLWSYSIYLWQQPFYEYKWAFPGPDYVVPLGLSLAAGFLSYTYVELPVRTYINNWWAVRCARALKKPIEQTTINER
jgi:peptidoglycan/LPS O-acetylase OafA/YrhL